MSHRATELQRLRSSGGQNLLVLDERPNTSTEKPRDAREKVLARVPAKDGAGVARESAFKPIERVKVSGNLTNWSWTTQGLTERRFVADRRGGETSPNGDETELPRGRLPKTCWGMFQSKYSHFGVRQFYEQLLKEHAYVNANGNY